MKIDNIVRLINSPSGTPFRLNGKQCIFVKYCELQNNGGVVLTYFDGRVKNIIGNSLMKDTVNIDFNNDVVAVTRLVEMMKRG